jgi:hypothetical protein
MIFPFLSFPTPTTPAFPQRTRVSRPALLVDLEYGNHAISVLCLVDSGADDCIFPASIAHALGIAVPNQKQCRFAGTSGQMQIAYFETIKARIATSSVGSAAVAFQLYAGFCDTIEHLGMGILGQNGFFSRYKVIMDRANEVFEIV